MSALAGRPPAHRPLRRPDGRDDLSLDVRAREIVGVIGPNGSGKTTLFNCVTGLYRASAGTFAFGTPAEIDRPPPHDIAERGISARSRRCRVFPNLSVLENVLVGRALPAAARLLRGALPRRRGVVAEEAERDEAGAESSSGSSATGCRRGGPPGPHARSPTPTAGGWRSPGPWPRIPAPPPRRADGRHEPAEKQRADRRHPRRSGDRGVDRAPHRARHAGGDGDLPTGSSRSNYGETDRRGAARRRSRGTPGSSRRTWGEDGERVLHG